MSDPAADYNAEVRAHREKLKATSGRIETAIKGLYQKRDKDEEEDLEPLSPQDVSRSPEEEAHDASGRHAHHHHHHHHRGTVSGATRHIAASTGLPGRIVSRRKEAHEVKEGEGQQVASATDEAEDEGSDLDDEPAQDDNDDSSSSAPSVGHGGADSDSDFDIAASKERVADLMSALRTDERTEVMEVLDSWFSERAHVVHYDADTLTRLETERHQDYAAAEEANQVVTSDLEEREQRVISMMHQMHTVISNIGLKMKRKNRPKTGLSDADYEKLTTFDADEKKNVELELSIQELRSKLIEKEGEMRRVVQASTSDQEQTVGTEELIEQLTKQQDEINAMQKHVFDRERRVRLLKASLEYVTQGQNDHCLGEVGVVEVIEEIRKKVRETKIKELMAKREQDHGHELRPPDENEVVALSHECEELTSKLEDLEAEIQKLRNPDLLEAEVQAQLEEIRNGKPSEGGVLEEAIAVEIEVEKAPQVKTKLVSELQRVAEEEKKLNEQIMHYVQLTENAEKTLKTMEDQRQLFEDSWKAAERLVPGNTSGTGSSDGDDRQEDLDIDSSPHALFTGEETEDHDLEAIRKQDEVLQRLRDEEKSLELEIERLDREQKEVFKSLEQEDLKDDCLKQAVEAKREEYKKISASVNPEVVKQVEELTTENRGRLQKIRVLRYKLGGFPPLNSDGAEVGVENHDENPEFQGLPVTLHEEDTADFEARRAAVMKAIEARNAGLPPPDPMDADETEELASPAPSPTGRGRMSPRKSATGGANETELTKLLIQQCSKDLREILDVQAENVKLAKRVQYFEDEILKARQKRTREARPSVLEIRTAREIRRRQRELNALRAQWTAQERLREHQVKARESQILAGGDGEGGDIGNEEDQVPADIDQFCLGGVDSDDDVLAGRNAHRRNTEGEIEDDDIENDVPAARRAQYGSVQEEHDGETMSLLSRSSVVPNNSRGSTVQPAASSRKSVLESRPAREEAPGPNSSHQSVPLRPAAKPSETGSSRKKRQTVAK